MVRGSELVLLHWVVTPGLAFSPEKLVQPFDIVSMQLCMHHTFETVQRTRNRCLAATTGFYCKTQPRMYRSMLRDGKILDSELLQGPTNL